MTNHLKKTQNDFFAENKLSIIVATWLYCKAIQTNKIVKEL